ncbi:MAG: hypothetical protein AMXMBFR49_29030 [Chlorobiota bacterium]
MIYGKNNIGKSYAISIVYMVLKAMPHFSSRGKLEQFVDYSLAQIDSTQPPSVVFAGLISRLFELEFVRKFQDLLISSYGSIEKTENKFNPAMRGFIEIKTNSLKLIYTPQSAINGVFLADESDDQFEVNYSDQDKVLLDSLLPDQFRDFTILHFAKFLNEVNLYRQSINYLPAVRSGIYLGYINFGSMVASLNQYQSQFKDNRFSLPNTTIPVSDYFMKLTEARFATPSVQFLDIIKSLEEDILGGSVIMDKDSGRISHYSFALKEVFDLAEVSSMVSELSIIVAYIKYVIRDYGIFDLSKQEPEFIFGVRPLLFIEEPEAHLHPEAQIKLMNSLSSLSNLGVHVIITTHSDYMLDCLGNIILGGGIGSKEVASKLMIKSKTGSIVSRKMAAKPYGIEDHNFLGATEKLFNERIELNEKYNARISSENKKS